MEQSPMEPCPDAEDLAFLAGGQHPEHEGIAAHVARCPRCQADLRSLERIIAVTRPSEVTDPGDAFNRAVWRRLAQRRSRRRAGIALTTAVAAAAAAVLIWLPQGRPPAEIDLVENLDLYQYAEIIEHLDALEGLDALVFEGSPEG